MRTGFNFREFIHSLEQIYKDGFPLNNAPQIWTCLGSGVATKALCNAFPDTEIVAVDIRTPQKTRPDKRATLIASTYKVSEPLPDELMPPCKSSAHFDAKVWPIFETEAEEGAIWLNHAPDSV